MRMRRGIRIGFGFAVLAAGMVALTALRGRADEQGGWKMLVPANVVAELIKEDTKVVNDALKAEKPLAKDQKRAKVAAMLLAIYGGADSKNGGLHGQAIKVIEALNKEEGVAEAKAAAAQLSASGGGDAKGDPLKAVWDVENKDYDRDLAMQLFKGTRAGGLGYEKTVKELSEKTPTAKDMNAVSVLAYKTAMLTQALERIPLKAQGGQKTPDNWKKFVGELRKAALETGEAASNKNAAAVKAGLGRMDKACVNCHEVFKNN
jgi:hypothetical protein